MISQLGATQISILIHLLGTPTTRQSMAFHAGVVKLNQISHGELGVTSTRFFTRGKRKAKIRLMWRDLMPFVNVWDGAICKIFLLGGANSLGKIINTMERLFKRDWITL